MPVRDLSLVSTALIRLLERYVPMSPVWGGVPPVALTITGDAPDLVKQDAGEHTLLLYLFHVEEDSARKNTPAAPAPNSGVRFHPMGLHLYYLLAAYGGTRPNTNAYQREQRLLGIAMKGFHDHPILTPRTAVPNPDFAGDELVFPPEMRDQNDQLRVVLHPLSIETAAQLWQANDIPLRLATVYQASVVLIEAERLPSSAIPVLSRSIGDIPFRASFLSSTERPLDFVDPAGNRRQVLLSPALVAAGDAFSIRGAGMADSQARLRLTNTLWSPPDVDATSWITSRADDRIDAAARSPVGGRVLVPGVYSIALTGSSWSNATPLMVMATVSEIDPASAGGGDAVQITGGPFEGADIRSVEVAIGTIFLQRVTTVPAGGQFSVAAADRIDVVLPTDRPEVVQAGQRLPVRVIVNHVSTPPTVWLTVA